MSTSNTALKNPFLTKPIRVSTKQSAVRIAFWLVFALNYLYLNRLLIVATSEKFRLGVFVISLSFLVILLYRRVVKNIQLAFVVLLLVGVSLLSAWVNNIDGLQLLAFIRIPITVYLIYDLVWCYLKEDRVRRVFQFMYWIAAIQLPVIVIQRVAYPFLPQRFLLKESLIDFGMGTFSGDTSMAFTLMGLITLLLFDSNIQRLYKRWLLLAGWLSITVLFSNSQVQHISIFLVWGVFLLTHLRLRVILISALMPVFLITSIVILSQTGLMQFPFLQNTFTKVQSVIAIYDEQSVDYTLFFEGKHARSTATHYYLNQPLKWIGDGPGSVYNTITGQRTVGGWGHIFTFYAEVGLIGWGLSILIFFVIAFPILFGQATIKIRASWIGLLMFLAMNIVTVVKYPMGNSAMIFTYCLILIGHRVFLAANPDEESLPDQTIPAYMTG